MKIALATTTIYLPYALEFFRTIGPAVEFHVAGDYKTPNNIAQYLNSLPGSCAYYAPEDQDRWSCSSLIPFNSIQRRNVAVLEAVAAGAELIVVWDDDNLGLTPTYFSDFERLFRAPWHGLKVGALCQWFDPGQLLVPPVIQRGLVNVKLYTPAYHYVVDAKVGVAQGLCLGNADVDAVTRMAGSYISYGVNEVGRAGVVLDPGKSTSVWNSQNTAFIRELAPAMFLAPGIGRHDDLIASLICQRVMQNLGLVVHYGPPFVVQQRNEHDLLVDLDRERWGMGKLQEVAVALYCMPLARSIPVVDQCRVIWQHPPIQQLLPEQSWKAALAFCDDMESVL